MKYSLIHPSRQRSQMAFGAFIEWISKATENNQYEYILSLDHNDPQINEYKENFKDTNIKLLISENRSMVDAVNNGAFVSTGDMLIVVSDDFGCPDQWDEKLDVVSPKLINSLGEKTNVPIACAIMIDDCINKDAACMTLPILSRQAYKLLGHIYNPLYFSMFADNELYDVCEKNGWLIKTNLQFEHRHYITGKNKKDSTYARENSMDAWNSGKKIYEQRKASNFT